MKRLYEWDEFESEDEVDDSWEDKKPKKKRVVPDMINYNDMMAYIDRKYEIHNRDYANRFYGNQNAQYLDFWHWLLNRCFREVHNPSPEYLPVMEYLNNEDTPEWVKEILKLIKKEFGDQFDKDGGLDVWVYW